MSDSNRLLFTAAAIGLIVCALIWGTIGVALLAKDGLRTAERGPVIEERAQSESEEDRRYRRWASATPRGVMEDVQPPTSEACEADPNCREKEDLRAQQAVALASDAILFWTRVQTLIAVLGTGLIWWGLLLNRDATEHSRVAAEAASEQARIASASLSASGRPWIAVDDIRLIGFVYEPINGALNFTVALFPRNTGQSPATDVDVSIGCTGEPDPNMPTKLQAALREAAKRRPRLPMLSQTIFPGAPAREIVWTVSITKEDLKEHRTRMANIPGSHNRLPLIPTIFGVVSYRSPYDEIVHTTGFSVTYMAGGTKVLFVDPDNPGASVVPLDQLEGRSMFGGWDAD